MLTAILACLAGGALWWFLRRRRAARDFTPEQVRRIEEIERGRDQQRAYYTRDV